MKKQNALEKAAEKYAWSTKHDPEASVEDDFKAGARWLARRILKTAPNGPRDYYVVETALNEALNGRRPHGKG